MEKSQLQSNRSQKQTIKSAALRAGKKTYFFDVKLASNNKKYLKITESSFEGEGKERKYNSFLLWPENIVDFQKNLTEITSYMAQ